MVVEAAEEVVRAIVLVIVEVTVGTAGG